MNLQPGQARFRGGGIAVQNSQEGTDGEHAAVDSTLGTRTRRRPSETVSEA